jgi:hypothetical protein
LAGPLVSAGLKKVFAEATPAVPLLLNNAHHLGDRKARTGGRWDRLLDPGAVRTPRSRPPLDSRNRE